MRNWLRQSRCESGYCLGEVLVALVIGAMVLTAVLTVYGRVNQAAEGVLNKIESPALAAEVLQCLAEDLDRVLGVEKGLTIQIKNGQDSNGFAMAQLVLRRTMRNAKNEEQVFEEITWRAGYDYDGPSAGLVIYRGHEGINLEDKLLDPKREQWESNYPLVPLCRGVTFFRIEVPQGEEFVDQWSDAALPPGIRVSISFAQPYETVGGTLEVDDQQKISRMIAIDKTRKIKFASPTAGEGGMDPNAVADESSSKQGDDKSGKQTGKSSTKSATGKTSTQPGAKSPKPTFGRTSKPTVDNAPKQNSGQTPRQMPRK